MSWPIERGRRSTLVAVVCALGVAGWAGAVKDAHAARLSIHAVGGQRVSLRLHGGMRSGAHDFVLDGKRLSRTRRRVITALPRHAGGDDAIARWRIVEVRRAGSGRLVARARFALAVPRSRKAPTLVLLAAPPSSTARTRAVLRFSVSGGTTSCAHNGASFRRCSSPITYKGLAAGMHRFRIRAANRHGATTIKTATTVSRRRDTAPSAPGPTPPNAETGRRLVFEDNFDGTRLNTANWIPYNSAGHAGNGLRRDSAIQLDGSGNLVITANSVNGQPVSGGMSTQRGYTYGWFEFRVRTEPDATGTMSGVVLTWPRSGNWPDDGENDIYETGTALGLRSPFYSYVHYGAANHQYVFRHDADAAQWHTMAMDWRAGAIRFYRDGALAATLTDASAIPDVGHGLCIQLDAMATRQLTAPVRMFVDYVRIYE
jgi:hypothetical protein